MTGWPLIKVISGGQTGADLGGLRAAKFLHYETGGMAAQRYMTETGPNYDLGDLYGLEPCPASGYKSRTYANVRDSDATVLFGWITEGTLYTAQVAGGLKKPWVANPSAIHLRDWIFKQQIRVLNVAGNRESKNPGIGDRVYELLIVGLLPF